MQVNKTIHKHAPLPFVGQKRQFIKHFTEIINDNIPNDGEGWTIVDAFGGSGLLSHVAKRLKPQARVIYNDFDDYAERIKHIDEINALRQQLAVLLQDTPRQKRIDNETKEKIKATIDAFDGYKDPHILCSWLLFSGQQIKSVDELYKHSLYNCIRQSDYPAADNYLDGIEVTNESFHQLLPKHQDDEKTLFVLDPPYLCTAQASYKQKTYFDLIDFLRLIHLTRPPYIFFSSTKSEFVRFIDWMVESKSHNYGVFEDITKLSFNTSVSGSCSYKDNLVYKF